MPAPVRRRATAMVPAADGTAADGDQGDDEVVDAEVVEEQKG